MNLSSGGSGGTGRRLLAPGARRRERCARDGRVSLGGAGEVGTYTDGGGGGGHFGDGGDGGGHGRLIADIAMSRGDGVGSASPRQVPPMCATRTLSPPQRVVDPRHELRYASSMATCKCTFGRYEQPLVVPQLEQTKQAPARCMTMPHW